MVRKRVGRQVSSRPRDAPAFNGNQANRETEVGLDQQGRGESQLLKGPGEPPARPGHVRSPSWAWVDSQPGRSVPPWGGGFLCRQGSC